MKMHAAISMFNHNRSFAIKDVIISKSDSGLVMRNNYNNRLIDNSAEIDAVILLINSMGKLQMEKAAKMRDEIIKYFRLELSEFIGRDRHSLFIEARCVFCYIAKSNLRNLTLNQIGLFIDRDHSAVLHYYKRANRLIDTSDKKFMIALGDLENILAETIKL